MTCIAPGEAAADAAGAGATVGFGDPPEDVQAAKRSIGMAMSDVRRTMAGGPPSASLWTRTMASRRDKRMTVM
jgi:hypothetical protein